MPQMSSTVICSLPCMTIQFCQSLLIIEPMKVLLQTALYFFLHSSINKCIIIIIITFENKDSKFLLFYKFIYKFYKDSKFLYRK
jgi:hypothetical protein